MSGRNRNGRHDRIKCKEVMNCTMKLTEEQWSQAKTLYITGQMSYRDLAERFGVGLSTVHKRGKTEDWTKQRADLMEETTTQTAVLFADDAKERTHQIACIYNRFVGILDKISAVLEEKITKDGIIISGKEMGGYINALRSLKEIGNIKTEQELREQDARLRLLEKQIAESTDSGGVAVTVSFEGVDGCEV